MIKFPSLSCPSTSCLVDFKDNQAGLNYKNQKITIYMLSNYVLNSIIIRIKRTTK